MRLSYSQWQTYARCPFLWKAKYILGIKDVYTGPAAERGSNIHNWIENYILRRSDRLPWDETGGIERVPKLGKKHPLQGVVDRLRNWPNGDLYAEKKFGFDIDWTPYPTDSDLTAFVTIMDAVASANGVVEIAEWKSGKPSADHADQRLLYALAGLRVFLPKEVVVTTYYIDLTSDPKRIRVPAAAEQELKDMWSGRRETIINDKILAPRPNDKCCYCHVRKSKGGPCPLPY